MNYLGIGLGVICGLMANAGYAAGEPDFWLSSQIFMNKGLSQVIASGPGEYDNALAMNVRYGEVRRARSWIESKLGYGLDYFKDWNPKGEAHITVITPPEYFDVLRDKVSMRDIARISARYRIQESHFEVDGIGSWSARINGRMEETFFFIVYSPDLMRIREAVYHLFVSRGGNPRAWNPGRFYPHITIGYTLRDLHESDGVKKNVRESLDRRFPISIWDY